MRIPTYRQGIANVSIMVSGSLWLAKPLHYNLENEKHCDVTSHITMLLSLRQSCGRCASVARLQPECAQFVGFGLRVKRYCLSKEEATEVTATCGYLYRITLRYLKEDFAHFKEKIYGVRL